VDWLKQMHCLLALGTTVVSVLHEIGMALHADDIVVMQEGQVVHHGGANDVATHAAIETVFDQRIHICALNAQWVVLPRIA
jgi:iron complex transport system ATP-binding protein